MSVNHLPEEQQREAVVAEARSWLTTPYHHEGSVKGAGVDCAYLLIGVWSAPSVGLIDFFRPEHYPPDWAFHNSDERYIAWLDRLARPIDTDPKPGDVAVWKVAHCFSHAAIVVSWPDQVIHASKPDRMVVLTDARMYHRAITNRDGSMRDHVFYSYWAK